MKRFPIELACYFEYRGVRPEEKRRLALYCVSVGPTSVNDLVRHHRIHCFAVNVAEDAKETEGEFATVRRIIPRSGEAKLARSMSWHIHHSADEFPDVVLLRES